MFLINRLRNYILLRFWWVHFTAFSLKIIFHSKNNWMNYIWNVWLSHSLQNSLDRYGIFFICYTLYDGKFEKYMNNKQIKISYNVFVIGYSIFTSNDPSMIRGFLTGQISQQKGYTNMVTVVTVCCRCFCLCLRFYW